jgi:hypothetical protein
MLVSEQQAGRAGCFQKKNLKLSTPFCRSESLTWDSDAVVGGNAPEGRACSTVVTAGENRVLLLSGLNDRKTFLDMFLLELDATPISDDVLRQRRPQIRPVSWKPRK